MGPRRSQIAPALRPTIRGRASAISTKRPPKAKQKQQTHKNANTTTNNKNNSNTQSTRTRTHGDTHQPRAATASTPRPPPRRPSPSDFGRLPSLSRRTTIRPAHYPSHHRQIRTHTHGRTHRHNITHTESPANGVGVEMPVVGKNFFRTTMECKPLSEQFRTIASCAPDCAAAILLVVTSSTGGGRVRCDARNSAIGIVARFMVLMHRLPPLPSRRWQPGNLRALVARERPCAAIAASTAAAILHRLATAIQSANSQLKRKQK